MASQGQEWVRAGTKTLTQASRHQLHSLLAVVGEGVPQPPFLHFVRERVRA